MWPHFLHHALRLLGGPSSDGDERRPCLLPAGCTEITERAGLMRTNLL